MALYTGVQYRLRAASPMPTSQVGEFVLHSFMAAVNELDIDTCTTELPASSEFKGQSPDGFTSANFSRLSLSGGLYFQGKVSKQEIFIEENGKGFN